MLKKIPAFTPLFAPLLSLALVVFSSAPFMTFLTVRLRLEGSSDMIIGWVQSFFYAGYLIGSIRAERFVKRIGYIRSFAAAGSLYTATMLIQGIFLSPIIWMITRFLAGISVAGLYLIIESWLLTQSSDQKRGRTLAIYMIAVYASQSFSQLLLDTIDPMTLIPFLGAGFLCSISIIPVAITYSKTPDSPATGSTRKSILEIYHASPYGVWGGLIAGLFLSGIYSFIPIFAQTQDLSVAWIMCITIGGGFLLQWPLGYLSDRWNRRLLSILISFAIVIPSLSIILFPSAPTSVYIFSFLLGGFCFTIYPMSISQVCDRIDPIFFNYAIGVLSLFYGIGAIVGPLIAAQFMKISPIALYLYFALLAFILGIAGTYYKIKRPKRIPQAEKAEYMPMPASTTPVAAELGSKIAESQPLEIQQQQPKPTSESDISSE